MRLRINNATLVTPRGQVHANVLCGDGVILSLDESSTRAGVDEEIDAHDLLVFPGFIDPHVHSRDPGLTHKEDFAHSTRAAAAGGITTLFEMPNAIPPVTNAAVFADRAAHHARVASVDFGLWGVALGQANLADLGELFAAGVVGVKLFWGYALHRETQMLVYNLADEDPDKLVPPPTNGDVLDICNAVARVDGLVGAHCEDRGLIDTAERRLGRAVASYAELLELRSDTAEAVAIAVAAELSASSGCRFHVVHTASARGVGVVRRAQAEGARLSAETCPHYLSLTQDDYATIGETMKVFPPIRSQTDQSALWQAVNDGTIASLGSDHAPHTRAEKAAGLGLAPAGISGVETMPALLLDQMLGGRITPERLAWVLAEGTARTFRVYPRKGAIEPGADADFTLVDPNGSTTVEVGRLHSKEPQSPWDGRALRGRVVASVLRGEVIARDGEPIGPPRGRLVRPLR